MDAALGKRPEPREGLAESPRPNIFGFTSANAPCVMINRTADRAKVVTRIELTSRE